MAESFTLNLNTENLEKDVSEEKRQIKYLTNKDFPKGASFVVLALLTKKGISANKKQRFEKCEYYNCQAIAFKEQQGFCAKHFTDLFNTGFLEIQIDEG